MIGRRTKFIFVHIPKNGGQSVTKALRPFALWPHEQVLQRVARAVGRKSKFDLYGLYRGGGHATAAQIRDVIGTAAYDERLSFAFVRNPWDRLLSLYAFEQRDPARKYHDLAAGKSLEEFLEGLAARGIESQWSYVSDASGDQIVDEIGRFERFEEDFAAIAGRLGIRAALPHKNRSSRPGYHEAYSERARALVADLCAEDIEKFGYTF